LEESIVNPSKIESHIAFSSLREIVLGGQDGLVNVLGIVLGIAVASNDLRIILAGGLVAAFAESVSMGAVAYTSTMAQHSIYEGELAREKRHLKQRPQEEKDEIRKIFQEKGFSGQLLEEAVQTITSREEVWLEEMMNAEFDLHPVGVKKAVASSLIVGFAAIAGSLIPLIPFLTVPIFKIPISTGVWLSLGISALALFAVGVYKAQTTVGDWKKSGLEMAAIGTISALVGFLIGYLFKAPTTL